MPQPRIDQMLQGISLQKRIRDQSNASGATYEDHRLRAYDHVFGANAEVEMLSCEVNLWCPYSQSRLRVPVRSDECTHLECIDLDSWCTLFPHHRSMRDPKAPCPICKNKVLLTSLHIDRWMERLLQVVDRDVKLVVMTREGELRAESAVAHKKRDRDEVVIEATQRDDGETPVRLRVKEEPRSDSRASRPPPLFLLTPDDAAAPVVAGSEDALRSAVESEASGSAQASEPVAVLPTLSANPTLSGGVVAGASPQDRSFVIGSGDAAARGTNQSEGTQVPPSSAGSSGPPRELFASAQELGPDDEDVCIVSRTQFGPNGVEISCSAGTTLYDVLCFSPFWTRTCALCSARIGTSAELSSPLTSSSGMCQTCGVTFMPTTVCFTRDFRDLRCGASVRLDILPDSTMLVTGYLCDRLAEYLFRANFTRAAMGYLWFGCCQSMGRFEINYLEGLCDAAVNGRPLTEVRPVPQLFWLRKTSTFSGAGSYSIGGGSAAHSSSLNGSRSFYGGRGFGGGGVGGGGRGSAAGFSSGALPLSSQSFAPSRSQWSYGSANTAVTF